MMGQENGLTAKAVNAVTKAVWLADGLAIRTVVWALWL